MAVIAQTGSGQILGQRDEQQDALGFGTVVLADGRRAPLAVLADGMGGHHGGAIAARLAIKTFLDACQASPARTFTRALEAALLDANRALAARSREDARLAQMGCTLIATAVADGVLHYVSVGDSLLWRIGSERIERLNADHSMVPVVTAAVAQGKMTHAEAQAHGSILRSAVTGKPIDLVDLRSVEVARDEWVLLASDGILSLSEAGVHGFVGPTGATAQARVDALLDAVDQVGEPEQDNCTVVLLPMIGVSAKAARRPLATVLGTLAIVAGLGVVGAAGWELLRTDRPAVTAVAVQPKAPAPPPLSEASVVAPPEHIPLDPISTSAGKSVAPTADKPETDKGGKKGDAMAPPPSATNAVTSASANPARVTAAEPAPKGRAVIETPIVTTAEPTNLLKSTNQDKSD